MATDNLTLTEGTIAAAAQKAYWSFSEALDAVGLKKEIVGLWKKAQQSTPDAATGAALKKAELDLMTAELQYLLAHAGLEKAISGTK